MKRYIIIELTSRSSAHIARVTVRDDQDNNLNCGGREFPNNARAWEYVEEFTVNANNINYTLTTLG